MRLIFTLTIFISSALLFLVQPMIAKMILPRFGGSPGVWNTSMVFFQGSLLVGYGYAHVTTKWLGPRRQAIAHIVVLALALIALPIALPGSFIWKEGQGGALEVLIVLALAVGIPFTVVSAGAPLLQRWFAATGDKHAADPYFLYSASNLGSLLALLAYPLVVEPRLRLGEQIRLWSFGFFGLLTLMAACALVVWLRGAKSAPIHEVPVVVPPEGDEHAARTETPASLKQRLFWIALAFCPSSLMLGVTTYLTSNIAPVPLIWVVPLTLYLLTFILAFAKKPVLSSALLGRILPLVITPVALLMVLEASEFMVLLSAIHLLAFFVVALLCHTQLAKSRPGADRLTEFYFYVSLGGVLGGIFNAIIAPTLFTSLFEYPLVLALALYFRPKPRSLTPSARADRWDVLYPVGVLLLSFAIALIAKMKMEPSAGRTALAMGVPLLLTFLAADRPKRYSLSMLAFFTSMSVSQIAVGGHIIEAYRSFFGIHRVESYAGDLGTYHHLMHGNTLHGTQNLDGPYKGKALSYYEQTGPIGQVMTTLGPRFQTEALVGLGVGSLAAYGQPGQRITYYEIDPGVIRVATNPELFTFLRDCKAAWNIDLGDARLELTRAADHSYDIIVLDAFSSDSIPVHLLTKEAFEVYKSKLKPGGLIAVHISNRYLNLAPVVGNAALAIGMQAVLENDDERTRWGKMASIWALLYADRSDLGALTRDSRWGNLDPDPLRPTWTDDYSNIVSVLKRGDD